MGTANSQFTVTASHIGQICPATPSPVLEALFADTGENSDALNHLLQSCRITSPQAVSMFLACSVYDSFGLTTFRGPDGASPTPIEWMAARARKWHDLKLNDDAESGSVADYHYVVDATSWGTANFLHRWEMYDRACAAFGVTKTDDLHPLEEES